MTVTYDPGLVLLSIAVAILGSLTALALTAKKQNDEESWQVSFALANGGLIQGATIWSMHFVAMMAVQFPILVNYNLVETIGSICIAIVATGTGLYLASTRTLGLVSIPVGAVLMGLGIAGMHYLGMSAIRGCGLAYDLRLVAASVGIAIVASMAALWFAFYKRKLWMTLAGGVVQGLAIASMHYTAMAATYFVPLGIPVELTTPLFSQNLLAYMIASGIAVVSVGNLSLLAMMSKESITREQIRIVQHSFRRLQPVGPQVAELFYHRLFETAPEVRKLFPADLTEQKAKFMVLLSAAIAHLHRIETILPAVQDLGRRHAHYGVTADQYEPVGQALLWTLEQALGREFTPTMKAAWTAAYTTLADTMIGSAAEEAPRRRGFPVLRRKAA
jgi:NO-binding membrane sensor protein with MHYT domain/hemoglobin-like flavoprotein